jgi:hypothetical protein
MESNGIHINWAFHCGKSLYLRHDCSHSGCGEFEECHVPSYCWIVISSDALWMRYSCTCSRSKHRIVTIVLRGYSGCTSVIMLGNFRTYQERRRGRSGFVPLPYCRTDGRRASRGLSERIRVLHDGWYVRAIASAL